MATEHGIRTVIVKGRFLAGSLDGPDIDIEPDAQPLEGLKIVLTPTPTLLELQLDDPPSTMLLEPFTLVTNEYGTLQNPETGAVVVRIPADYPATGGGLQRIVWKSDVQTAQGRSIISKQWSIPEGATEVDLTTVTPIPNTTVINLTEWEALAATIRASKDIAYLSSQAAVQAKADTQALRDEVIPAIAEATTARDEAVPAAAEATTARNEAVQARADVVAIDQSFTTPGRTLLTAPTTTDQRRALSLDPTQPEIDRVRRNRFGTLGTSGKPVISFRVDHCLDRFIEFFAPIFNARSMPYSIGIVTTAIGTPGAVYEGTTKTWADVRALMYKGGEIWSHSRTHGGDVTNIESEIIGARDDLLAAWIQPAGWQQPGAPSTYGPINTYAELEGPAGRMIRATYPLFEAYLGSPFRILPTYGCRGLNHITADMMTLADAKSFIDRAVASQAGLQIMFHPNIVGTAGAGRMTLADFTALVNYVADMWDADTIEAMSGSGLAYADPSSTFRRSVIPSGSFDGSTTAVKPYTWRASTAWRIGTDGGHTGPNYLRLIQGEQTAQFTAEDGVAYGMAGGTYLLEGWYRVGADGTGNCRPRLQITTGSAGLGGTQTLYTGYLPSVVGPSGWVRVRRPFQLPADASSLSVQVGRYTTDPGTVDWDDLRIIAI